MLVDIQQITHAVQLQKPVSLRGHHQPEPFYIFDIVDKGLVQLAIMESPSVLHWQTYLLVQLLAYLLLL